MSAQPLWIADDAATATGGHNTGGWEASGISIDTRTLESGDLFVALAGPNFDGHRFVGSAFDAGAAAAMVAKETDATGPQLVVDDTLDALRRLGEAGRARMEGKVVAVTGSVGKTGTKEALAHALAQQGSVSASRSSLNNHWGVPLSLARMPADTDFGIFEIGMNHPGEITPLTKMARPDVAIVTAIAPAHMEFFDSVEDIARAKAEIFCGMYNGVAVINRDSEYFDLLSEIALTTGAAEVIGFGRHVSAEMRLVECLSDAAGSDIDATWRGTPIHYRIGQPGTHWAYNSLAVLAAVDALGGDIAQAAAMLATLPALPGRGAIHVVPWGDGQIRVIDDSYNANPESMSAALKTLGHLPKDGGRRVAILGDMLELGDISRAAHANLKDHVEKNEVDLVFLAGTEIQALADALDGARIGGTAPDADDLLPMVVSGLRAGDVVSVKASNGIGLGRIVAALLDPETNHSADTDG